MDKSRRLFAALLSALLLLSACRARPTAQTPAPTVTLSPAPTPVESVAAAESPAPSEAPAPELIGLVVGDREISTQVWDAVQSYCETGSRECAAYALEPGNYESTYQAAVDEGCTLIITDGHPSAYFQVNHPEVSFLWFREEKETAPASLPGNTLSLRFDELQLGYLAGYAAVSEGCTKLGYLGDAFSGYGYGFIQGANDAAEGLDVTVEMYYWVTSPATSYFPDSIRRITDYWYETGVQLLFSTYSTADETVIASAEEHEQRVIVTRGALSELSAAVLTVARKDYGRAVARTLAAYGGGSFPGGEERLLGCDGDYLTLDISRLANLSQYDYEYVYGKLAAGTVTPLGLADALSPEDLPCPNVAVFYLEMG